MEKIEKCVSHGKIREIFCKKCNVFICPECLSTHQEDGHIPDYIHIMKYAPEVALPLLDHMLTDISGNDSDMNMDAVEFVESLSTVVPSVREIIDEHTKAATELNTIAKQLSMFISPLKKQSFTERVKASVSSDLKRLNVALEKKEIKTVINIARKIEIEQEKAESFENEMSLVEQAKDSLANLSDVEQYMEIMKNVELLISKCQHMRLYQTNSGWKLDKKYLTSKMTLSEDGLEYGNSANNGYPAIIGDVIFDTGIYVYEVTPMSLCCGGNEGFGIIEYKRYLEIFSNDQSTPTAYNDMIGLFHNNTVKGMETISGNSCTSGSKYIVKVDLVEHLMIIKGPSCHLKATLKVDTEYVPCFSLGCRNNKMIIKPLDTIDIDE